MQYPALPRSYLIKLSAAILLSLYFTSAVYSQSPTEIPADAELYRNIVRAIGNKNYGAAIELGRQLIERTDKFEQVYARIVEAAKAAGQLEQAKKLFESLLQKPTPNPRGYYGLGLIYGEQKSYAAAIEYYKKCISAQPEFLLPLLALVDGYNLEKKLNEAQTFIKSFVLSNPTSPVTHLGLGYYYAKNGQLDDALVEIDKALFLDPKMLEACFYKSSTLYQAKRRRESLAVISECVPVIDIGINDEHKQAFLNLTAAIQIGLMNYSEASGTIRKSSDLAVKVGDKKYQAVSTGYLALVNELQGNYSQALIGWRQASELSKEINDSINLRRYPWRIGNIHYLLGELPEARQQFEAGLQMSLDAGDKDMQAIYLSRIGDVFAALNQPEQAIAYYKKLTEIEGIATTPALQLFLLDLTYPFYLKTGKYQQAQEAIQQALTLAGKLSDAERELRALNHLGELRLRLNTPEQAVNAYEQAFQLAQDRNSPLYAWTACAGLATAYERLGRMEQARARYLEAIGIMEQVRARLVAEEEKAGFFQDKIKIYKDLLAVLMRLHGQDATQGHATEAFAYAERARGRAFLDLLAEAKVNLEQNLAPDLLEQRQNTQNDISRVNAELLAERALEPVRQRPAKITQLQKSLSEAEGKLADWVRDVRQRDPRYAALKYPEPISLAATQQLLDDRTVLLAYSLSEPSSFLFAVSRNDYLATRLEAAPKIRAAVEQLLAAITDKNQPSPAEYRRQATRLYQQLIMPAQRLLAGKSELIIVADDALHRLPFEVLLKPTPTASSELRRLPYLVRDFAISYAPSASVLASLQNEPRRIAPKEFVAFADPIYPPSAGQNEQTKLLATVTRGASNGQLQFPPLPHSRREVETIAKLFAPGQADLFLRAAASEENAKTKANLGQYGMVHFSAHGYINEERPRFSGLVLSLPQSAATGQTAVTEDGLLSAYEIFNLKLNAELVVLSACETGLGKEVKGEGLMSLMRAFMYAGAPSVVVSLWQVDDQSAADLMISFYRNLKKPGAGMSKAAALRQAQLEAIEQGSFPYYWAPFVLIGKAR